MLILHLSTNLADYFFCASLEQKEKAGLKQFVRRSFDPSPDHKNPNRLYSIIKGSAVQIWERLERGAPMQKPTEIFEEKHQKQGVHQRLPLWVATAAEWAGLPGEGG